MEQSFDEWFDKERPERFSLRMGGSNGVVKMWVNWKYIDDNEIEINARVSDGKNVYEMTLNSKIYFDEIAMTIRFLLEDVYEYLRWENGYQG